MNKYGQSYIDTFTKQALTYGEAGALGTSTLLGTTGLALNAKDYWSDKYINDNKSKATTKILGIDTGIVSSANKQKLLENKEVHNNAGILNAMGLFSAPLGYLAADPVDSYLKNRIINPEDLKDILSGKGKDVATKGIKIYGPDGIHPKTGVTRNMLTLRRALEDGIGWGMHVNGGIPIDEQNQILQDIRKRVGSILRNKTLGKTLAVTSKYAPAAAATAAAGGIYGLSKMIANAYRNANTVAYE